MREIQRKLADFYARAEDVAPGDRVAHVADGPPDLVFEHLLTAVLPRR